MLEPCDRHFRGAVDVLRRLRNAGHTAFLTGGCVRDMLLGMTPRDYDIATDAPPVAIEALFDKTHTVGKQFGVCQVWSTGYMYEVATFRRESSYSDGRHPDEVRFCGPQQDARRRDFTVNAMFLDPESKRVLDYVGGRDDLEKKILRAVGEPEDRFREDHLRLIRAVRFSARLGFEIEQRTWDAMRRLGHLVTAVSPERLQQELRIITTDRDPSAALRLMDHLAMLTIVFPELADTRGCEQPRNYHPEGDVFVHTMLSVEKLGPFPEFETAMAALLHDVGKPPASRAGEDPLNFRDHSRIGSRMAARVCRRLRLPNRETQRIRWLVERHLYFKDARNMRDSTLKKLFAEPGFLQLAELHRVDALASWGNLEDYQYVMMRRATMPPEEAEPPRLVTGEDLIEMGYAPGPMFGEVLDRVRDAQLDGEVQRRQAALEMAREQAEAMAD